MNALIVLGWFVPVAIVAALTQRHWLAPAPFLAGFWCVAVVLPMILLDGAYVSPRSLAYIAIGVTLWVAGGWLATATPSVAKHRRSVTAGPGNGPVESSAPAPDDPPAMRPQLLTLSVVAGTAAAWLATAVILAASGFNFSRVLSLEGLLSTGNSLSVQRYAGLKTVGAVTSVLLAASYAACILAPFAAMARSTWKRGVLVAPALSVLVYSTVTTERLTFLIATALTLGSYLAMRLVRDGSLPMVGWRSLTAAVAVTALVASAFVAIAFVRVGRVDAEIGRVVVEKLEVYSVGYLPAFSVWLSERDTSGRQEPLGLGSASVAGLDLVTGQDRKAARSYDRRVVIDPSGNATNIYTGWRYLLHDFGEALAGLFLYLGGFFTTRLYVSAATRRSLTAAGALACAYAVIMLSHVLVITTFTNVLTGMVAALLVLATSRGRGSDAVRGTRSIPHRLRPSSRFS